jgi:phosphate:Na+ symporter
MSGPATDMLEAIGEFLGNRDPEKLDFLKREDDKVDYLRQRITPYLARLSEEEMSEEDSAKQTSLMETTVEIEHVGDLASKNIHGNLVKLLEGGLHFSEEGRKDLCALHREVLMVFYTAMNAFASTDQELARKVVEKKEEVDELAETLRREHFSRLNKGLKETLETTTIHLDLIDDLREINSYSHRIARNVLGER